MISCIRVLRLDPDFDDEGFVSASVPCGSAHDVLGAATPCVVLAAQRGGGGDGGTTGAENRTAFMEMYKTKRVGELDRVEERKAQWTSCALSGAPLTAPVVADALGAPPLTFLDGCGADDEAPGTSGPEGVESRR